MQVEWEDVNESTLGRMERPEIDAEEFKSNAKDEHEVHVEPIRITSIELGSLGLDVRDSQATQIEQLLTRGKFSDVTSDGIGELIGIDSYYDGRDEEEPYQRSEKEHTVSASDQLSTEQGIIARRMNHKVMLAAMLRRVAVKNMMRKFLKELQQSAAHE